MGFFLWLFTLVYHLCRSDISDTDRIVWAIVLCTLNLLGMLLYWFLAPVGNPPAKADGELKENSDSRSSGGVKQGRGPSPL